jgi:hypothetical protein
MKRYLTSALVVAASAVLMDGTANALSPDARAAIAREFGEAQARNIVLVGAAATDLDPSQWNIYGRDPHRASDMVMMKVTLVNGRWQATSGAAGRLNRLPGQLLDFQRLRVNAATARQAAKIAATMAKTSFVKVEYQLAANERTAVPEWGLVLQDAVGKEIGFCIVSGETGAVTYQDWTAKGAVTSSGGDKAAEAAARKVKQGMRQAWNWTEDAGRKTGSFFKELFKRD